MAVRRAFIVTTHHSTFTAVVPRKNHSSDSGEKHDDASRTITVNAASPIAGGGGLVKAGAGTLVLARSNSVTGATAISAGTLALAATASRPTPEASWTWATAG